MRKAEISVERGKALTVLEVVSALQANGAIDVRTVKPDPDANMCETMIFCTGLAAAHRRRLANVVVRALKARRLKVAGSKGFEGAKDDDWMLVDAGNIILQVMTAEARRHLALERHWSRNMARDALSAHEVTNEKSFLATMEKFVAENPLPEEYMAKREEVTSVDDEKTLRRVLQQARKPSTYTDRFK